MTAVRLGYVRTLMLLAHCCVLHVSFFSHPSTNGHLTCTPSLDYITAFCLSESHRSMRRLVSLRLVPLSPPASYPHIPCPKSGERCVLLSNVDRLCPSHHMHRIPLSTKHHVISCISCKHHRVVPSLLLFPVLFHQGFLG